GLVRRKRYGRAIKLLRGELERRRGDRRLRLRLGEVLLAAGERVEGVKTLSKVADDLAAAGQVAQAIAVLKKIDGLEHGPEGAEDVASEAFRDELVALLEETLSAAGLDAAGTPPDPVPPAVDTPLFRSLTRDELVALMRGLRLLAFEPGQIIVSEGEAGGS